ncbi:MAG: toxin-antitoxin system HicB family antitoxin [Oscillospiraceae bacterium]|nr:toxin-antitoxin system HicB family antitoxin [Oscillospiraceae bacterium]MBR6096297.1 toxin-antitoxin system HicB family antitoxin [Oscillospiraceae bacterium]
MNNKISTTMIDIEARFAEINALEPESPTQEDLEAIERARSESPDDTVSLKDYKLQREYSGRLLLRIPKELHKQLIEAARENGVSLNQYALYKLAK